MSFVILLLLLARKICVIDNANFISFRKMFTTLLYLYYDRYQIHFYKIRQKNGLNPGNVFYTLFGIELVGELIEYREITFDQIH